MILIVVTKIYGYYVIQSNRPFTTYRIENIWC